MYTACLSWPGFCPVQSHVDVNHTTLNATRPRGCAHPRWPLLEGQYVLQDEYKGEDYEEVAWSANYDHPREYRYEQPRLAPTPTERIAEHDILRRRTHHLPRSVCRWSARSYCRTQSL